MAATEALAALAQGSRLAVFRRLVRVGPDGLPAGEIARMLDVPANTMSAHLAILHRAGLITARREGRSIFYSADFAGIQALMTYLVDDCCQGRPELCGVPTGARPRKSCSPPSRRQIRETASRSSQR